ncbi:acylamino-acid-releasing enzyme-like isoform X1 [Macrosteles quadrilineatus]|uniref:acylamino-acid-releasing enzyme-like isoform X1 n=1 Tax=Macrosteles quadrilineatus TaxID=74068 RepID=UPI0023E2C515|nr:acylamino-acid-releasing enzyme-like isoform X1 [Macrosteles quadrilineatus]
MAHQFEHLVAKYRAVSQFPGLSSARILCKEGSNVVVSSAWSQKCLEKGKNSKFMQTHFVTDKNIIHTTPVDISNELLSAWSPSGVGRAVLREHDNGGAGAGGKKQHLEIWRDNRLAQLIDLSMLDQHGDVYTSGEFSCLEWSPCEKKLLYVAEKKQPKAEPFYPSKPKDKDSTIPDEKLPKMGEEHVFRQDWGETMVGKHQPVLCVCDLTLGTVSVTSGIPDNVSVGQALWVPDGIVAVAWPHTPRRLGIVYCTSRPSYVFHLTQDGTFIKLSKDDVAAQSPRLSPDGEYLVWLQRPVYGPHHACQELVKAVWGAIPHPLVPIVQTSIQCASGHVFYGLYCQSLPARCFIDNNKLMLSTGQHSSVVTYSVNTDSGAVCQVTEEIGSVVVMDVCTQGSLALCYKTVVDTPPSLYLAHINKETLRLQPLVVRQPVCPPPVPHLKYVLELQAEVKDKFNDFNAIYYGPYEGEEKSVPLIVWPHGGPHAMFFECYSVFNQFFVSAGFATLQVNFRGSTGVGQAGVDFLPGRVGDTDVKDCHQATLAALKQFPILDPGKVVLYGGSHGGFLVTHLAGQYPDLFRAVVAVNPVVDLVSMLATTDIPDWAVVEAGFTYTGKEQVEMTPEFLAQLRRVSPIQYADKVKAPTLLNIGKKDLRVPPSQGTMYYHTLKTFNVPCKMNLYDDNHSLSTVPVDIDATINTVLWFQQHLAEKQ